MKCRTVTREQRRFHDALCSIGCIACRKDGRRNTHVSVHHIDGRTKPWAHWLVLPLCAGHHQDATGAPGLIAVHPFIARFQNQYGHQGNLLSECLNLMAGHGIDVPEKARLAANGEWERMAAA